MKKALRLIALLSAVCASLPAAAGLVGNLAPPLYLSQMIKGQFVDIHDQERIYVVEFWATWCGPCQDVFPHLTALQQQYGSRVVILAITDEEAAVVQPFVAARPSTMDYTIALDYGGWTFYTYDVEWIPQAFIVGPHGDIVWNGHSADLDAPLALAVSNLFHFSKQPLGGWMEEGRPLVLETAVAGSVGDVHYAWTKNGVAIGGDEPVYSIAELDETDSGTYVCTATDEEGGKKIIASTPAVIKVMPQNSLPVLGTGGMLALCSLLIAAVKRMAFRA
jgi:thiol-disulfide isomerase/thioredoxin